MDFKTIFQKPYLLGIGILVINDANFYKLGLMNSLIKIELSYLSKRPLLIYWIFLKYIIAAPTTKIHDGRIIGLYLRPCDLMTR